MRKTTRKTGAGTPHDPSVRPITKPVTVPVLAHGHRRSDQSYALAIAIGGALLLIGLAALAAYLHYLRGVDLTYLARNLLAPGGLGVAILGLAGWVLRERLAPQQAGIQREVAAVKVELEKAREARATEQSGDAAKIATLEAGVAELRGMVTELAATTRATGQAVIAQRAGIDAATNAALDATAAVVNLQQTLLGAAQAQAQAREDAYTEQEARRARDAAEAAAEAEWRAQQALEADEVARVRAAGARLQATNDRAEADRAAARAAQEQAAAQVEMDELLADEDAAAAAAGAGWLQSGRITTAPAPPLAELPPVTPVGAVSPAEVVVQPSRVITPLDPEWVVPATGELPAVPPKTDPALSTAVHYYISTGKWPPGVDPEAPRSAGG